MNKIKITNLYIIPENIKNIISLFKIMQKLKKKKILQFYLRNFLISITPVLKNNNKYKDKIKTLGINIVFNETKNLEKWNQIWHGYFSGNHSCVNSEIVETKLTITHNGGFYFKGYNNFNEQIVKTEEILFSSV